MRAAAASPLIALFTTTPEPEDDEEGGDADARAEVGRAEARAGRTCIVFFTELQETEETDIIKAGMLR